MNIRSAQKELIDLGEPSYTESEYLDCLKHLGRIGRFLGGDRATLSAFNTLKKAPCSILDVGCGGGDFARVLAHRFPKTDVTGIDFSGSAIGYAKRHPANGKYPRLAFEVPRTLELNIPAKSVDVITATLVCHHMSDSEVVDFLKRAKNSAAQAIIINDLHRSRLAYSCFNVISRLFFPNRLIIHDGLISITRGFTKNDWVDYLQKAGFKKEEYRIQWKWAFRWIIIVTL